MDSSDESASETQNLLAKFLSHPGTTRTSGRPGNRPTLRGTQTPASTITIKPPPSHVETHRPPQPPTPKVGRPRRKPLVDSPNGPLADRTLPARGHTRGRVSATRSRGTRAHAHRVTPHISQQSPDSQDPMGRFRSAPRSRRSRGRPANYYAKSTYSEYAYESESDNNAGEGRDEVREDGSRASKPKGSVAACLQVPAPLQHKTVSRVIYASGNLRLYRRSYCSFDEIVDLPRRVPYVSEANALDYVRRCEKPHSPALQHVSLSNEELEAMVQLLALFSVNPTVPDVSLADQIIQMVKSLPSSRLEDFIISQIFKMKKVHRWLARYGFNNLSEYHDGKERLKNARQKSMEALLSDIDKATVKSDSSQWLAMAAKLDRRRKSDILAFVSDARLGSVPTQPHYVVASLPPPLSPPLLFRENLMFSWQQREHCSAYGLNRTQTWKGASNDVISLAWSPDGTQFAVGAAAHCDEHNRQYNRPNNLLIGNTPKNSIRGLPDHRLPYHSLNASSPYLYMSVSAVQWYEDVLYTASYDKTVKLWNVSSYEGTSCTDTLQHDLRVQVMARPHDNPRVLATGTDSALHLWHMDSKTSQSLDFTQQRSNKTSRFVRNIDLLPSALAWGSLQWSNLLVAGFSGKEASEGDPCREGLLAMWRLTESSIEPFQLQPNVQNIFDVKFHPTLPWLATGSSVPAMGTNGSGKDIRSLVRVYEPLKKTRCALELDCPALDINDVTFCPMDRNIISASCTDGVTYVWDYRNPGKILHRLAHGNALNQLNEELTREQADVGVRVALWDNTIDNFVTGGSDGALKSWNILRAPEDVFVRDIAVVGNEIMSGALSPDKSSLVIGDDSGGIHVFAKGAPADDVRTMDFDYEYDDSEDMPGLTSDSGRAIGQQLLSTGQLVRHPTYGVGQGPAYQGPYAAWARPEGTPTDMLAITPLLEDLQLQQLDAPGSATHREQQRRVAAIRNKPDHKRKRHPAKPEHMAEIVNLCSDDENKDQSHPPRRIFIDLTSDSDSGEGAPEEESPNINDCNDIDDHGDDTMGLDVGLSGGESDLEDYWFPDSGDVDANIRHSSD